jgi:hypothetical protein
MTSQGYAIGKVLARPDAARPPIDVPPVEWEGLLSSGKGGFTQFIAELDDTLVAFAARFMRNFFTYGEFTFGWGPFVQDLKNLFKSFDRLNKLIEQQGVQRYSRRYELPQYDEVLRSGNQIYRIKRVSGWVNVSGTINLKGLIPEVALDTFGLHFDQNVVWDLIPLSFLVDYIIPIGDMLESIRPSGWVRAVPFDGWVSSRDVYHDGSVTASIWSDPSDPPLGPPAMRYTRTYHSGVFTVEASTGADWEFPSFKEMFNLLYVTRVRGSL